MRIAYIIKVLWLIICVSLALWGILAGNDADIVAIYLIGLFTLPSGLLVFIIVSFLFSVISKYDSSFGVTYNSVISALVFMLAIMVGYFQWYVLLPRLIKKIKNERSKKVWGVMFFSLGAILYGLYWFYFHVNQVSAWPS